MKEQLYPYSAHEHPGSQGENHKILAITPVTDSTYILRFEKRDISFRPGQYVSIGLPNSSQLREYSIYSPVNAPYIEVLIKEVEEGSISKQLKKLPIGATLKVEGPFGFFMLPETELHQHKYLFIASGTGISPFHSIITSTPTIDFLLLHGVRNGFENYGHQEINGGRYILCTSRDNSGDFHGRVTDWLKQNPVGPNTQCYLCGNCDMIYDSFDILEEQGVPAENLHAEVYF